MKNKVPILMCPFMKTYCQRDACALWHYGRCGIFALIEYIGEIESSVEK